MSCNRAGRLCQPAGDAVGGGDTELVQMTGRRSAGNCPQCGQFMWPQTPHTCPTVMTPDYSSIAVALNKAITANERRNFIIVDGVDEYFPMVNRDLTAGVTEVQRLSQTGGTAAALYVSDKEHHPANDPRRPVAIYHNGQPAMVTETAREAVDQADWRDTSAAVQAIMDRLGQQQEIPTAGQPAEVFGQLGVGRQSEELRYAISEFKERVDALADEGLGLTHKDFEPLRAVYEAELDRRIEAQAGSAMTAAYTDLGRGYWEQGHTETEVNDGCEKLTDVARNVFGLPGEIGVMWNDNGDFGFSGDSELVYIRQLPKDPDRPELGEQVETYSLPSPFLEEADLAEFTGGLRRIARREAPPDAVYPGEEVTCDGHNWGPWRDDEMTWDEAGDDWEEADDEW